MVNYIAYYKNRKNETSMVGIEYGIQYFENFNGKPAYYVECLHGKYFRSLNSAKNYMKSHGFTEI